MLEELLDIALAMTDAEIDLAITAQAERWDA
jgi:hypothetical protein